MTKRPRTATVWVLRIEDQLDERVVTVTSRSELVGPSLDSFTRYPDAESAIAAIRASAAQLDTRYEGPSGARSTQLSAMP